MVEARIGWEDDCASACQAEHVFEVDSGKRGFTWHQDELSAFLEGDVGGALNQVVRQTLSDRCQRSHRAGTNNHGVGRIGATGHGSEPLLSTENVKGPGECGETRAQSGLGFCRA